MIRASNVALTATALAAALAAVLVSEAASADNSVSAGGWAEVRSTGVEPANDLIQDAALALSESGNATPASWEVQEFSASAAEQTREAEILKPAITPINNVQTSNRDMFVGQVDVLGEVAVSRVAVGQGSVIRAEILKSGELMVIAQAPGSSSLRLWHLDGRQSDFNIRVDASDPTTRVRMESMVRMRVRMVEFRKSAVGRLGIRWADDINGPGYSTVGDVIGNNLFRPAAEGFEGLPTNVNPFSTYFGIATNVTSRINLLAANGDAVTLAEPVLTARNGGTASFLAGGEVPFPTVGDNGQTVIQFKEYGIKLNVAPRVDEFGHVHTAIETEISQLDEAVSIQGTPGLLTRRAETQVNVRSGETIVISGLLSSESSDDVHKLPGLGSLPILGRFFRSSSRRDSVRELVIFVTPEVVDTTSGGLAQRDQQRFDQASARLEQARDTLPLLD